MVRIVRAVDALAELYALEEEVLGQLGGLVRQTAEALADLQEELQA